MGCIQELLHKYHVDTAPQSITIERGTGSHPSAVIRFTDISLALAQLYASKFNDFYWRDHMLSSHALSLFQD